MAAAYRAAPVVISFFADKFVPLLLAVAEDSGIPYRRALVWHKPPGSQYAGASLDGFWYDFEMIQVFGKPAAPRRHATDFGVLSARTVIGQIHGCQKPVEILLRLIEGYTLESGIVLDPFLGSGTTAVAAKQLGRHFLGFEISEEYAKQARERIALVEAQPSLFSPKAEQLSLATS